MTYVYLTDDSVVQSNDEPTEADVRAVRDGEMQILKLEGNQAQYLSQEGPWYRVDQAVVKPGGRHQHA